MFVIFLRFGDNRAEAAKLMAAHNAWVREGLHSGDFLLVGSLADSAGGAILARGDDRAAIEARVARDPFVAEGVVSASVHAFTPRLAAPALDFLLDQAAA